MKKYCNFDDVDARYFANIFWYNDKIRHFSLADNEKITAFGIKTLLNIKEYNKVLQELLVYLPGQYENPMDFHYTENATDKIEIKISSSKEINIFDKEAINAYLKKLQEENLDYTIENKNLRVNTTRSALEEKKYKDAGILFRLITESYNEIIGRGNLDKVLMLFGLEEMGKTVIGCQLSDSTNAEKFTVTELNKLKPVDSEHNKKIRHSQIIDNNPNNQSNQNNPVNPDNTNKEDDYKRVNNFLNKDLGINIMECSGIHGGAIDQVQEILDLYAYWQIIKLAAKIKFGIIIIDNNWKPIITNTIKKFIKFFKNETNELTKEVQENLKDALFYIVNFATECGTEERKNNKITGIKKYLEDLIKSSKDAEKLVISQLIKSVHLFKKANFEEVFSESLNLKDLLKTDKWWGLKEVYISPISYKENIIELPEVLAKMIKYNIEVVGKIIIKFFEANKEFIEDPIYSFFSLNLQQELASEMFSKHYDLLERYLPRKILPEAISPIEVVNKKTFSALQEIKELKDVYTNNIDEHFKMIPAFLEIIRKFYNIKGTATDEKQDLFQEKLGNYVCFIKQQLEALSFCKKLFPHSATFEPLKKAVDIAGKILIEEDLLSKAIIDIKLEPYKATNNTGNNQQQFDYYKEVLSWLNDFSAGKFSKIEQYSANFTANEMKAKSHYFLGMLYENNISLVGSIKVDDKYLGISYKNNNWLAANEKKLYSLLAVREYIEALKIELKEYCENTKAEKDYSFMYGSGECKTTFSVICSKIGNLLLNLGKSYDSTNQSEHSIPLILRAMKYFMISVNLRYIEACDTILTGIFDKQPRDIKDNLQKQLCKSLGKYLLKLGLFRKAEYKFQEAQGLTNDSKEQIELEVKINEIRGMGSNLSFLKAKREKGEFEDLSIFKEKALGKLVKTKKLLNNITKIPQETQYKDLYDEIDPPQPQAVIQPEPQPQQSQAPVPSAPNPPVNENVPPLNPNEVGALGENNEIQSNIA
ncbi:hypothetical protein [Rickettsia bellii]|nr:hypothetical protein [Rickettsia bellii]